MYASYDPKKRSVIYTDEPRPLAEGICDFCGHERLTHLCPANDVAMPNGDVSLGAWAACSACAACVTKSDASALRGRAIRQMVRQGFPRAQAAAVVVACHACFWDAKAGEPVPVDER